MVIVISTGFLTYINIAKDAEPDIDIPISFIGARPGEKQFEELFHDSEKIQKTLHKKIFKIRPTLNEDIVKSIMTEAG